MKKMARTVLFAVMAVFSTAVFAEDVDPCATPENLTVNDGVYQIGTCGDLYKFAEMVNSGAAYIKGMLTADICLNACNKDESVLKVDGTLNGDGSNYKQWTPIGASSTPYKGTFDGNGYTISGLYFSDENAGYAGAFGNIGSDATVQNFGVVDSYIKGRAFVGGVVGYNGGSVSNVYNTGAVSGNEYVGGVVGNNGGTVSNVYNTGAVSGNEYVGGVVGNNGGTVSNVYNTGVVSGVGDYVGGVMGTNGGSVANAYYNTDVSCEGCNNDHGTGKTTAELAALTFGASGTDFPLLEGEAESPWIAGGNVVYDRATGILTVSSPHLKNLAKPQYGMIVSEYEVVDNVIQIADAGDLKKFAGLVNDFGVTDVYAKLTADICLNACGEGESVLKTDGTLNGDGSKLIQWTPIGTDVNLFAGTFDGDGHTISGLYFDDDRVDNVGLFGYIGNGAKVQNVGVMDSYFKGSLDVGGVVGRNEGTVSNVFNSGSMGGIGYVGGVVGANYGPVSNVYNTGAVHGGVYTGGVVGDNCGTVSNVYNTGTVNRIGDVGGVVGRNNGTISNAYFNTDFNAEDAVGGDVGGVGRTTAELATLTFGVADADFPLLEGETESPWAVGSMEDNWFKLPYLRSFGEKTGPKLEVMTVALLNIEGGAKLGTIAVPPNAKLSLSRVQVNDNYEIYALYKDSNGTEWEFEKDVVTADIVLKAKAIGVVDGVYQIGSADDLHRFAGLVNSGKTSINGRLTADICLNACGEDENVLNADGTLNGKGSEYTQWTPIRRYEGTFDGKDAEGNIHVIRGLYLNDDEKDHVGLFGYILNGAKVQNMGVEDSYIRGNSHVGGVVGYNEEGSVSNAYNSGSVSGSFSVGGVVGYNEGGTVSNAYNSGSVRGSFSVGGVVGNNGGTVSNVYNTGSVKGSLDVGGVVGYSRDSVANAYYNADVDCANCESPIKGTTGKTTAELAALDVTSAFGNSGGVWNGGDSIISRGWRTYTLPSLKGVGMAPTAIVLDPNATEVEIGSADELFRFAEFVNAGNNTLNGRLTADICLNSCGEGDGVLNETAL